MVTRKQELAQSAFCEVSAMEGSPTEEPYARVCKSFPALMHNSGLCQAVAFAQSKSSSKKSGFGQYLNSLATVLGVNHEGLAEQARTADVMTYQRLTHEALAAASWLKRYAEALLKDPDLDNKVEEPVRAKEEAK